LNPAVAGFSGGPMVKAVFMPPVPATPGIPGKG